MCPDDVTRTRRRLSAVPWSAPIPIQFSCDDKPRYGCRLCILIFGLKPGDRHITFEDEAEASAHTRDHAKT